MTVMWVLLGVAGIFGVTYAVARWASSVDSTAVRREAERGVQDIERFLAQVG